MCLYVPQASEYNFFDMRRVVLLTVKLLIWQKYYRKKLLLLRVVTVFILCAVCQHAFHVRVYRVNGS